MQKEEIRAKIIKIIVNQIEAPTKSYIDLNLLDDQELDKSPLLFGSWDLEFTRTELEKIFDIDIEERYGYDNWFKVSDVINYICKKLETKCKKLKQ